MEHELRLSGIAAESIVDGPGIRYVLFTQGCLHACKGCHNPETHSIEGGYSRSIAELFAEFCENPLLCGITFSGGEPFLQAEALCWIAEQVKTLGKTVFVYSGYSYEQLLAAAKENIYVARLLDLCDGLVDGPYIQELQDLELAYRGSSNQRVLDRAAMLALLQASQYTKG